jgi:hypothetical protein
MPLLAGLISGLFASLANFIGAWVTKKVAFGVAAVATFAALTIAMLGVLTGFIDAALAVGVLPASVIFGFAYFMPASFPACVAAIVAADIAIALYKWNVENLKILAYVT